MLLFLSHHFRPKAIPGTPFTGGSVWLMIRCLELFVLLSASMALSIPSACAAGTLIQSAIDRDGSEVRLISNIDKTAQRKSVEVQLRPHPGTGWRLIGSIELALDAPETGAAQLIDWDQDGSHEVQIISECGAGPNCEGVLYRIDKSIGKLVAFFNMAGSEVQLIGGHLVESARDSCCSWVASAHKFDAKRYRVNPEPAFTITVKNLDDAGAKAPVLCTFSIENSKGRKTIAPPAKAFLKVCRLYGEKYVVAKE